MRQRPHFKFMSSLIKSLSQRKSGDSFRVKSSTIITISLERVMFLFLIEFETKEMLFRKAKKP